MAESDVYTTSPESGPDCYHTTPDCRALKRCRQTRQIGPDQVQRMGLQLCQYCAGEYDNTGPYGPKSSRGLSDLHDPGQLKPEAIKRDRGRSKRIANIMAEYSGPLDGAAERGGYIRGETNAN